MILDVDPKQKKKKGAEYFELDEDLDEAWILEHQAFLVQELRTKIEKKFQKDNEKLVADGQKEMKAKELEQRLEAADELEKKFKKENKSKKVEAEGKGPTVEKYEAAIKKLDERIATMLLQAEDREGNKEVALGTSKIVSTQHLLLFGSMLMVVELYRPPSHSRLRQEIQCSHRKVLLQDSPREVQLGHRIDCG
jgi:DNA topoisomerase-1